jgi:hypothetical protein
MASKPVFSAEFTTTPVTATFTIFRSTTSPIVITPYAVSVTIPADRYWLGESTDSRSLWRTLRTAMNAVVGVGDFEYNVSGTSDNLGVVASISYDDSGTPGTLGALSIGVMNSVAVDAFWALGFRNPTTITFTVVGEAATALTTGIPRYSWFPKAFAVNQDDYTTVVQQAASSRLTGAGSLVASVRQDDGVVRWWRSWRMTQVAAARCSYPKATSTATPEWATIAGLTSNPGDAALDKDDGWWQRTCAGQYRFATIEDESTMTTSPGTIFDVYRIIDDPDAPVGMGGWRNLRTPNVAVYSTAGATRTVELCAVAARVGTT